MKSCLFAAMLLLAIRTAEAAQPIVYSYWSPTDVQNMLVEESTRPGTGQPPLQGVGFPLLLVFAADGSLSWHGDPREYSSTPMEAETKMAPGSVLATALDQMDVAARLLAPDGAGGPAERISDGAPTAVLVVLAAEAGVCSPCDKSLEEFSGFPSEWNRIVVALSGQW